jgi:hypothetical protein
MIIIVQFADRIVSNAIDVHQPLLVMSVVIKVNGKGLVLSS